MSNSATTTFAVPVQHGARLRELAKRLGTTAGAVLAQLIDTACDAAGIGIQKPAATIRRDERTGTYDLMLFDSYLIRRSAATLDRLASALIDVADTGGVKDGPNYVVYRKGAGVVLGIEATKVGADEPDAQSLTMSPLIAKLIANAIREALLDH